jgi:hypothetical protein
MLGIGQRHRRTVARLAVFSLLFQAFFAALHLPGIQLVDTASAGEPGATLVICSGGGLRHIPADAPSQTPDGRTPGFINCPICLTLSCCTLAMPAAIVADAPTPIHFSSLIPAAPDTMRDRRQAIRPGHGPPASV